MKFSMTYNSLYLWSCHISSEQYVYSYVSSHDRLPSVIAASKDVMESLQKGWYDYTFKTPHIKMYQTWEVWVNSLLSCISVYLEQSWLLRGYAVYQNQWIKKWSKPWLVSLLQHDNLVKVNLFLMSVELTKQSACHVWSTLSWYQSSVMSVFQDLQSIICPELECAVKRSPQSNTVCHKTVVIKETHFKACLFISASRNVGFL